MVTSASDEEERSVNSSNSLMTFTSVLDDLLMLQCFLNHQDPHEIIFPLDYGLLRQQQFDDLTLKHECEMHPNKFPIHDFGYSWKIAIPMQALSNIMQWYHCVLNHVGMT